MLSHSCLEECACLWPRNPYDAHMTGFSTQRVPHEADPSFSSCWDLYNSTFPPEERRELEYQIETLKREEYHLDQIYHGDDAIGFIAWWSFDTMIYIEHFALDPSCRGQGYGDRFLREFIQHQASLILLEVEIPEDETQHRRVTFYQRIGFYLNEHPYVQPPLRGEAEVPLMVMTYPRPVTEEQLDDFRMSCFPIIHFRCAFCA